MGEFIKSSLEFIGGLIVWIVIIFIGIAIYKGVSEKQAEKESLARCEVISKTYTKIGKNQNDSSKIVYRLDVSLKNVREAGYVTVYGYADSIEKKFSKSEKLYLSEDEKEDVSFYFAEVDLYASNLSFNALCKPSLLDDILKEYKDKGLIQ